MAQWSAIPESQQDRGPAIAYRSYVFQKPFLLKLKCFACKVWNSSIIIRVTFNFICAIACLTAATDTSDMQVAVFGKATLN